MGKGWCSFMCVCMHACVCACVFVLCVGGARWRRELFFRLYMCTLCLSVCWGGGGVLHEYFVCFCVFRWGQGELFSFCSLCIHVVCVYVDGRRWNCHSVFFCN